MRRRLLLCFAMSLISSTSEDAPSFGFSDDGGGKPSTIQCLRLGFVVSRDSGFDKDVAPEFAVVTDDGTGFDVLPAPIVVPDHATGTDGDAVFDDQFVVGSKCRTQFSRCARCFLCARAVKSPMILTPEACEYCRRRDVPVSSAVSWRTALAET